MTIFFVSFQAKKMVSLLRIKRYFSLTEGFTNKHNAIRVHLKIIRKKKKKESTETANIFVTLLMPTKRLRNVVKRSGQTH